MTNWLRYLAEQGARFNREYQDNNLDDTCIDTSPIQVVSFGDQTLAASARSNVIAPLTHLGLISAVGDDAASFLHNQLSNDIEHLDLHHARLAAYCTPKGRLLADFLIWKDQQGIVLQITREIQAGIQKRLQMYVMRSKVKLADISQERVMLGLTGPAVASALMPWFPTLPLAIYDKIESAAGTLIRHPNDIEVPRYQWITSAEQAIAAWPSLTQVLQPCGADVWHLAEIESGTPHIVAATQEKFVPQMINFELLGGVNFQKGCYPGQEIVARSQYLGKLKRRMLFASVQAEQVMPGTEIFSIDDPLQPCGMVVNAERDGVDELALLVEIKLAAAETEVRLGSAEGPALLFKPLPYPLTDPA